jgi:hypothetical protein
MTTDQNDTTMADVVAEGQQNVLRLLLAEMEALRTLMPGLQALEPSQPQSASEHQAVEAAVEAGFDNMPV